MLSSPKTEDKENGHVSWQREGEGAWLKGASYSGNASGLQMASRIVRTRRGPGVGGSLLEAEVTGGWGPVPNMPQSTEWSSPSGEAWTAASGSRGSGLGLGEQSVMTMGPRYPVRRADRNDHPRTVHEALLDTL